MTSKSTESRPWMRILNPPWKKMDPDPSHKHFFKINKNFQFFWLIWGKNLMSRNSEIRTFIIILRAKSFSYSFYWICKFLWIRILKAKMLRIGSWKPKRLESNGNGSQALQLWIFNKSSNLDQLFYVTQGASVQFSFRLAGSR